MERVKQHRFNRRLRRRQWSSLPFAAPTPPPSPLRAATRPLISVVMPVYNHARYLNASIESTLAAAVNYPLQLIVVNDGSKDGFGEVVAPFRKDPRVVVLEKENGGIASALNAGFARADGPLLSWTSADNRYRPGALDRLADYLIANPTVGLVFGNVQLIDDTGSVLVENGYRVADQLNNQEGTLFLPTSGASLPLFPDNFINACFLYRSTVSDAVGSFDPTLHGCEDYDYWLRVSTIADVAHVDTDDVLYEYRLHGDTLTATLEPPRLQRDVQRILQVVQSRLARHHGSKRVTQRSGRTTDGELAREFAKLMIADGSFRSELAKRAGRSTADLELEFECANGERSAVALHTIPSGCARVSPFDRLLFGDFDPLAVGEADPATGRNAVLFAPHDLSPLLHRARGANFLAVEPAPTSCGVCGIFLEQLSPDSLALLHQSVVMPLLSATSAVTLALLCSNRAEREVADMLHLQSPDASQLRIIDLSEESIDPSGFLRSLTYVLSSLDLLIAPNVCSANRDLCRSVGLARVAAAAGISVLSLLRSGAQGTSKLHRFVGQLPNLLPIDANQLLFEDGTMLAAAMEPPDQRTLDQLLIESSRERFFYRLLALAAPVSR